MNRKWIYMVFIAALVMVLAACNQTVEEQAMTGMGNAEEVFASEPNERNKSLGQLELYLPKGYSIETGIDELNYTIHNGNDSYILFVNEQEANDSQLHYDLLKQEGSNEIIDEKTFEKDDVFGFSAVTKLPDAQYELIVSLGGVKLSTISESKKIDHKIQEMMEIVKTVQVTK